MLQAPDHTYAMYTYRFAVQAGAKVPGEVGPEKGSAARGRVGTRKGREEAKGQNGRHGRTLWVRKKYLVCYAAGCLPIVAKLNSVVCVEAQSSSSGPATVYCR